MNLAHPVFGTPVPRGWRIVRADDIKAPEPHSCVAGPFGSNISSRYFVPEGVPVIRGNNLTDDLTQFVPSNFVFVSPERARRYAPQHVRAGDLVFTCWGSIGQVGRIPQDGPFEQYVISNKQLKLRSDPSQADSGFLFYYFASPPMVEHIRNRAVGSAVPGINLGILKSLPIGLPPLPAQRKIASVLSAYDDLIETNLRRISLLEEMAQRIYHEWFVNFRIPGHQHVRLVPSAAGPVPEGWRVGQLQDLVEDVRDAIRPGEKTALRPYVPIDCITAKSLALIDWKPGSEAASSLITFEQGDVLFGAMRPYFHKVAVAPWRGTTRTTCFVLRVCSKAAYSYAVLTLFDDRSIDFATSHASGTTIPYARWKGSLATRPVVIPDQTVMAQFDSRVRPILEWLTNVGRTLANLRATRDLLLPRLISGEVDVEDLDIPVEEAAA